MFFLVPSSTLEIALDLNCGLFSPSEHDGKPFFSFAPFQELKEGMESRNKVQVGLV